LAKSDVQVHTDLIAYCAHLVGVAGLCEPQSSGAITGASIGRIVNAVRVRCEDLTETATIKEDEERLDVVCIFRERSDRLFDVFNRDSSTSPACSIPEDTRRKFPLDANRHPAVLHLL